MNSDEPTIQLGKLSKSSDKKQIQKPLRESLTYRTYIHIHCKCIAHAILCIHLSTGPKALPLVGFKALENFKSIRKVTSNGDFSFVLKYHYD